MTAETQDQETADADFKRRIIMADCCNNCSNGYLGGGNIWWIIIAVIVIIWLSSDSPCSSRSDRNYC